MRSSKNHYLIKTILITLRVKDENGEIVGYVKGAPLETYELRPGTFDYNVKKQETEDTTM